MSAKWVGGFERHAGRSITVRKCGGKEERAERLGERKMSVAQSGLFSETILCIHAGLMILMRRGTEAANRGRL